MRRSGRSRGIYAPQVAPVVSWTLPIAPADLYAWGSNKFGEIPTRILLLLWLDSAFGVG